MIGRTLGSYRIVEQIGLGGMATIYKAYDAATDRYVAVKTLPEYYSKDPAFRQRFEREHTSSAGEDDYRTEGNVMEVRCDTTSEPQYDVAFPTHTPYLVIATHDGNEQLRLLYDTKTQCQSAQVGDYAEADGEKQTEQLFDVHNLTIKRRR